MKSERLSTLDHKKIYATPFSLNSLFYSYKANPNNDSYQITFKITDIFQREGCKPYLPLRQRFRNDHPTDLPVLPDANFVGLFALGVR